MQYGDVLIGNKGANRYRITNEQTQWTFLGPILDEKRKEQRMADIYVVEPSYFIAVDRHMKTNGYTVEEAYVTFRDSTIYPVRSDCFDVMKELANKDKSHVLNRLED